MYIVPPFLTPSSSPSISLSLLLPSSLFLCFSQGLRLSLSVFDLIGRLLSEGRAQRICRLSLSFPTYPVPTPTCHRTVMATQGPLPPSPCPRAPIQFPTTVRRISLIKEIPHFVSLTVVIFCYEYECYLL